MPSTQGRDHVTYSEQLKQGKEPVQPPALHLRCCEQPNFTVSEGCPVQSVVLTSG